MALPLARFKRLRRLLGRFERGRSGAAAVEFAMLALPFLALLFGIIELGMIYLIAVTLSDATAKEARKILTCQDQSAGTTATQFQTAVCKDLPWLGSQCGTKLSVDARTYSTFSAANAPPTPITKGLFDKTVLTFQMGSAGDIVLVRTYYPWTLVAPGLDGLVAQLGNNQELITAAAVFRNEPCS